MKRKILIVEDNVGLSQIQKDWLSRAGYDAVTAMSEPIARSLIRKTQFDLILSDVRLPEGDGISLLEWLRKEKKDIPFIITTEFVSVPDVVRTIKLGARDYLPKPVHREHLLELAEDVFHPVATVRKQERQLFRRISPMILKVEKFARLVAPSDMSVMILGANGTGKESVAQTIHDNSERYGKPFVAVNCGALPRELAASLFFGHEKGAFTGADTAKTGYFDLAKGGTLFLDEIGTMPHEIQSMLLRVLQENVYTPIGSGSADLLRIETLRVSGFLNDDDIRFIYRNLPRVACLDLSQAKMEVWESAIFDEKTSLKHISLPQVAEVMSMACYGCSALEEVVIPEGTTKIGGQAFYECRALTDVYCRAGVPPLLGIQVFEGTSIKNLYVPEGSADAYREAEGWSLFEHIEEREF